MKTTNHIYFIITPPKVSKSYCVLSEFCPKTHTPSYFRKSNLVTHDKNTPLDYIILNKFTC